MAGRKSSQSGKIHAVRPEASAVLGSVTTVAEMSAVVAAAMSPPPDLDWDEMALDDAEALDWAAA